jgi:hypothetical protein
LPAPPPRKGAVSAHRRRVEQASQLELTDSRQQFHIEAESKMMKRQFAVSGLAGGTGSGSWRSR